MTAKITCGYIVYNDYKSDPGNVYLLWEHRNDAIDYAMKVVDSIAEDQHRFYGVRCFDGESGQSRESIEDDLRNTGEVILLEIKSETADDTLIRIVEAVKYGA